MVHESSDDGRMYRSPLGYRERVPLNGLMTLQTFIDGGYDVTDAKILVVVKSIGAKKRGERMACSVAYLMLTVQVTRKDESVTDNVNLHVHDNTSEATLGLWGSAASSPTVRRAVEPRAFEQGGNPDGWKPGETVLLLQAPGWKIGRTVSSSIDE